jgi:hypothetical protein
VLAGACPPSSPLLFRATRHAVARILVWLLSGLQQWNKRRADRLNADVDSFLVIAGRVVRVPLRRSWPCTPLLALCLVLFPGSVLAQTSRPNAAAPDVRPAAVAGVVRPPRISTPRDFINVSSVRSQRGSSRDSLKNGVILGAAIGAAAFGTLAAVLCRAYQEEGGPSCVPDTLRFAAIGGALGSGIGLAVDAVRTDARPGVSVRLAIRF